MKPTKAIALLSFGANSGAGVELGSRENSCKKMISQQLRNMLRGVTELTATQFEELQATMERMRVEATRYPSIEMGDEEKSAVVNTGMALPRSGQARGIANPARSYAASPTESKPVAKENSSPVAEPGGADRSLTATVNDRQRANSFAAIVEMVDDEAGVAETPVAASVQHFDAPADLGALTEQQCAVLVLLIEGLPSKVLAERLAMTERAAKDHVTAILGCLGVASRKQAILIVKRQRLAEVLRGKPSRTDPGARDDSMGRAGRITYAPPEGLGLTQRQGSVLNLLLEGLPNKLIARRLGLTVTTVKEHVSAILRRLGLRSRAEVISLMDLRVEAVQTGDSFSLTAAEAGEQNRSIGSTQRAPITPEALGLTQRQGSVLILLLEGLPNKIIARRLGLTENTVKEHVSGILQRLDLRTRTEVISRMKRYHVRHTAADGTPGTP